MKHLLYVGHEYHSKTKSTSFLREIFEIEYQIDYILIDPQHGNDLPEHIEFPKTSYDVVVFFQVMPPLAKLLREVKFGVGVLFPMYDYYHGCVTRENPVWSEYRDFVIINFSKTLHEDLVGLGYSSRYIQYFPEPKRNFLLGCEKSVFLWQRTTNINGYLAYQLLERIGFDSIHLHLATDPGQMQVDLPASYSEGKKITRSTWFETREALYDEIEKSSIYIAPREFEGIGMSFLEAMAMGRCVIAPDHPTMNEYITHGKNGLLYRPEEVTKSIEPPRSIRAIQVSSYVYIKEGFKKWQVEKLNILKWISDALVGGGQVRSPLPRSEPRAPQASVCGLTDSHSQPSDLPHDLYPCSRWDVSIFGTVPLLSILRRNGRTIQLTLLGTLNVPISREIFGYE